MFSFRPIENALIIVYTQIVQIAERTDFFPPENKHKGAKFVCWIEKLKKNRLKYSFYKKLLLCIWYFYDIARAINANIHAW